MITYLPEIYPDELVYSWFCRYYVHSGCCTYKMALENLLYKKHNNPSKEFIGHLNNETEFIIKRMYGIDELIINHTMFPQYARFIPLESKKNALYKLGHDYCDVHHLFSVRPRKSGEFYLRYCPVCVKEDRKKYGETYWHRKHQIRNMMICTKHKCKLIESDVTAKSEQTFTLCDAESHITDNNCVMESNSLMVSFAEYMTEIFDLQMDFKNDIPLDAILYNAMSKTKYMKSTGKSRYTKIFSDDVEKYYQKINLPSIASLYQIQRTILGYQFDFSVVCQIAFFLGISVQDLTSPVFSDNQKEYIRNERYANKKNHVDWADLDKITAPLLKRLVKDIYTGVASEIGRPERVSERLIYKKMDLPAHRLEKMPICKAILEKYTESYPESYARKIIWAYRKLIIESNKPIFWSDIRMLSGVKKKNFQLAIPFLSKYANSDIVNAIINLVR